MRFALILLAFATGFSARAAAARVHDRYFVTSDGVRLHYLEAGPATAHTHRAHPRLDHARLDLDAADPAPSPATTTSSPSTRAGRAAPRRRPPAIPRPVAATTSPTCSPIANPAPVLIVGWSLGVLDTLAYVHRHGDARLAGLVLVDNSVGEEPPPRPHPVLVRIPARRRPTR